MRIPTIHINGTNGLELFDQVTFASLAVEYAMTKLRDAWPNSRDYYVQGNKAWGECINEWQARIDKLEEVRKGLEDIAEAIAKQLEHQGVNPWAPR